MTDLLIATHDQALHAIRARVDQPDVDPVLRGVVLRVLDIHGPLYSDTNRPNPDCGNCDGRGFVDHEPDDGGRPIREHCHCGCPWCIGCEEPLCRGACPTVAAIADRLDLLASSDLPEREDHP